MAQQKNVFLVSLVVMISLMMLGCGQQTSTDKKETKKAQKAFPAFNADSAYNYVARQVAFGPRVTNTKASAACASYIESELKKFTPDVQIQVFKARAYDGTILNGRNIVASFNLQSPNRVVLSSHWDSRPYADSDPDKAKHTTAIDGANDGASGVGVLMELARVFSKQTPDIGVDIVLFDAEDYGPPQDKQGQNSEEAWGLGSQYWAKNPHVYGYKARYGILLDMVGVPNPTFLMEGFSTYYAPAVVKKVWDHAAEAGYGAYFIPEQGTYITDDHYFVNKIANIPMINIIHLNRNSGQSSFFEHWHTINDDMDHIDKKSLGMVGEVLVRVIYSE